MELVPEVRKVPRVLGSAHWPQVTTLTTCLKACPPMINIILLNPHMSTSLENHGDEVLVLRH